MKLEIEFKDPKFKIHDNVLVIYLGVAYISSIRSSSISLHYNTDKGINDSGGWCYGVSIDGNEKLMTERGMYLLDDIEKDIREFGIEATAKKHKISLEYIQFCSDYMEEWLANWKADGRAEAAMS